MTPTTPPGPDVHPGLETLADLQEGLLPPPQAAAVSAHLAGCAPCRSELGALEGLPARLAAAGAVGAMPEDVVRRVQDALDGEGRPAAATITPLAPRRRGPGRDNRVLQAAAGLVLVLAATAVGVSAVQDRSSDDSAAAGKNARELPAGSVPVLASGADYTADSVAAAVPRLLATDAPSVLREGPSRAAAEGSADDQARLGTGAALSTCVSALTDDPDTAEVELPTPLVVDIATFGGQPATVIVLPTPDEPATLDVYVVGPDCAPADAKVLHFARVPRP